MKTTMRVFLILGLFCFLLPLKGHAVMYSFNVTNVINLDSDGNNTGNTGTTGPWATIALEETTYKGYAAVKFVVDIFEEKFDSASTASNFGLQSFTFMEDTGFYSESTTKKKTTITTHLIIDGLSNGWDTPTYLPSSSFSVYGKFDFLYSGTGSTRQDPLEFYIYSSVAGEDVTIEDFIVELSTGGFLFAGHIGGYGDDGTLSAQFASDGTPYVPDDPNDDPDPAGDPVPEPSTIILLGLGLLGVGFLSRKKK